MSKRLQGHLTNSKNSSKTRVRRKVRTEYMSDAVVGRAVEIRKTSDEQFRLQLHQIQNDILFRISLTTTAVVRDVVYNFESELTVQLHVGEVAVLYSVCFNQIR